MDWLFFVVFGPLVLGSLIFCPDDRRWWRGGRSTVVDLDAADRREFGRFIRSRDSVPDPRLATVDEAWAQEILESPTTCR